MTFRFTSTVALSSGQFITATATSTGGAAQAIGDTSEFSGQAIVTASGGGFSISGKITYGVPMNDASKLVPDVLVTAMGPMPGSDTTEATGDCQIDNLTPGGTYIVTPSKSGQLNNAISSFDATLVLRCVAAGPNCSLTTNQQIAADTNNSNNISSFDATLILRFVAANGLNANTGQTGTWEFDPQPRTYSPLLGNQQNQNYEAILLGDVNGSWVPPAPPPQRQTGK